MSNARNLANLLGTDTKIKTADIADEVFNSNRNLVINGAMQVSQRGTSSTGVTASGYRSAPDRFRPSIGNAGTWTISQSTDAPEGFSNSYKFDCTTAKASLDAGSDMALQYRFEGQDLQMLKKGTSNAASVTVSFYVKSTKTGTFILELMDNDNNREISKAYTVSASDTWEEKEVTFEGDTTGTLDNDNAKSFTLQWWLVAGTNFTSGTLNTSWSDPATANRVVGQVNIADSTSNNWLLTGVQLEVGDKATPFEHRSFGDELLRCQRYFVNYPDTSSGTNLVFMGRGNGSTQAVNVNVPMPVVMRATPTFSQIASLSAMGPSGYNGASNVTPTVTGTPTFEPNLSTSFTGLSGLTDNRFAGVYIYSPFSISAEL